MSEVAKVLARLGISLYLDKFIEQGFDTWETILNITESDFDALGVKPGHRRKLQREVASSRGLPSDSPLAPPSNTPIADGRLEGQKAVGKPSTGKCGIGAPQEAKRKYRRHPKPDVNSPKRPPTAYVIYSNKMREEWKGRNLSFTEMAKLVGENWQNLSPRTKESYKQHAFSRKKMYHKELAEYKKTEDYRDYSQYLVGFKARQSKQAQATELEIAEKVKPEPHFSTTSSGTSIGSTSLPRMEILASQARQESSGSNISDWTPLDGSKNLWPAPSHPSFSSQTSISIGQQPPKIVKSHPDYPAPMLKAPTRDHTSTTSWDMPGINKPNPRTQEYALEDPSEYLLDPVSALLRAGEIISRNSRTEQSWGHARHYYE